MNQPTVLLTNDDGGSAEGIRVARRALAGAGFHVVVMAPEANRSAIGHAVTCRGNLTVSLLFEDEHGPFFTCTGTPADCVRLGILSDLTPTPDVVVSGINHGVNMGDDIHYSGTVSAAVEAALLGVPAIAVSQHGDDDGLPFLATTPTEFLVPEFMARMARWVAASGLAPRTFLNVNVPGSVTDGSARIAQLGSRPWRSVETMTLESRGHTATIDPWATEPGHHAVPGTDFDVVDKGAVSVTPISVARGLVDLSQHDDVLAGLDLRVFGETQPSGLPQGVGV